MIEIRIPLIAVLLTVGWSLDPQQVGETVTKRGTILEDVYLAGGTIDVSADVQGDVVAAGGRISIGQRVTGDVLAAGGTVDIGGDVLDDVRVAGGTVTLHGHVGGDAVATGGTVELEPEASVGGRAWFGGGDVRVAGRVATHLKAAGQHVTISGTVHGDVQVTGQEVEILPSARIAGSFTYRSPHPARIDSAAVISGGVVRLPYHEPSLAEEVLRRLIVVAALGALGAVLILVFPGFSHGAVRTLSGEPWLSVGLGAAVLVGTPVAAVLLMVTVVGSALGVASLVVYALALMAGFLTGALCTGDLLLGWMRPGATSSVGSSVVALLVALIAISLVRWIPVLGGLVSFGVLLFGLGALVLQGYRAWKRWRAGSGAPAVDGSTA
jgi:cytoskeletal protein CcmA (bactofilin family)